MSDAHASQLRAATIRWSQRLFLPVLLVLSADALAWFALQNKIPMPDPDAAQSVAALLLSPDVDHLPLASVNVFRPAFDSKRLG